MPSPFPGMDPYLEDPANWSDFHHTFIAYAREVLLRLLPRHYTARIGDQVYLMEDERLAKKMTSDISVQRQPGPVRTGGTAIATKPRLASVTIPLPAVEEVRQLSLEILHRDDRSLVTAFELLSPSNKRLPGRERYLDKRNGLILRNVNIVEVDLLLGGQRLPMRVDLPEGDYFAFVSRGDRRPDCEVYAWEMPDPLPALPIPLRSPDADAVLDLGAVLALVYDRCLYEDEIDYAKLPPVRVSEERLKWIDSLLHTKRSNGTTKE